MLDLYNRYYNIDVPESKRSHIKKRKNFSRLQTLMQV